VLVVLDRETEGVRAPASVHEDRVSNLNLVERRRKWREEGTHEGLRA